MTDAPESKRPAGKDAAREKRLAEALRANLRRRKEAAKGRPDGVGATEPAPSGEPGGNPEAPENPDESG
jgi:hypothetical protein